MYVPQGGIRLPLPVDLKPYMVAGIRSTREELRTALGEPHFVESDSTRTYGGDEDMWAWELPSGQQMLLVLHVPFRVATLYCDPANPAPAFVALGIDAERREVAIFPTPL